MSTWTLFVKIWTVSNFELDANFLTFLDLYHLIFALETSQLNSRLMANIWEKAISILVGNLNSGPSYLITTVLLSFRDPIFVLFWPGDPHLLIWTPMLNSLMPAVMRNANCTGTTKPVVITQLSMLMKQT